MPLSVQESPSIVAASAAVSGVDWQLPICGGRSCKCVCQARSAGRVDIGDNQGQLVAALSRKHLWRQVMHVGVKVRLDMAVGRASLHRTKPALQIRICVVRAHTEPLEVGQACCHPLEEGREEAIDESHFPSEKEGPTWCAKLAPNECQVKSSQVKSSQVKSGHSQALRGHSEALRGT